MPVQAHAYAGIVAADQASPRGKPERRAAYGYCAAVHHVDVKQSAQRVCVLDVARSAFCLLCCQVSDDERFIAGIAVVCFLVYDMTVQ